MPDWIFKSIVTLSNMAGGLELVALVFISFLLGDRAKCFYYIAGFTIDKALIGMLKLVYSFPRPLYAFGEQVRAVSCSREFGNPSGHSSAAWFFALMLFLDLFHGDTLTQLTSHKRQVEWRTESPICFYLSYTIALLLATTWALLIPFSRFLMGAHTLD